ncbi:MAG: hypothetical protein AB1560_09065 [Pseudomonadota bacterium]
MATIHVRNVPGKLYKRILKLAKEENRSIASEVIQLLILGLQARQRMADLVGRIAPPHSDLRTGTPRLKQGSEKHIRAERDER